ncbi:DUF4136 domain-containing protein [Tellurirhabdus rosea]|uniref:DUF4136 domain-containing protein n=1 Tax=Tellurirhabdus rosea TaxID=2674997 RepID=UPI00224F01D5|nr:DUF4136 domain-containing protein [Tellurirhabdus rosea]
MTQKLIFLLLTGLVWACSSVRVVDTKADNGFSLARYKTYNFYSVETTGDSGRVSIRPQVDRLKEAITRELESRGLRRAAQPDLLVNIGLNVAEKVQTRQTSLLTDPPNYIGQRRYTWRSREVEVGRYKQGTVDIHLVDRSRNEMVWQGVAEGVIPDKPDKRQKRANESMAKLFEKVPQ